MTKIFVNGTFDIVHLGHIKLLEYARCYPNSFVLVAIDSDIRVKQLKDNNRLNQLLAHQHKVLRFILRYI